VASDMILRTASFKFHKELYTEMKKLLVFALGLGIVLGTVSFAADDTSDTTKTKKAKKAKKTKSTDAAPKG
jgi:hypothetical protein